MRFILDFVDFGQRIFQESINLQYNTLVRWSDGTTNLLTKHLMFQVFFFFIISHRLRPLESLYIHFCNFINWRGFCKEYCKILWKKNNTWNTRPLVNESFITLAQQTSVLYCRLTDFKVHCWLIWRCMQKEICHLFGKFFCLTISWSVWIWQWEER